MIDLILVLAILIAAYMAWNIGANDVANAMGTSVGSGALTFKRAVILAAILAGLMSYTQYIVAAEFADELARCESGEVVAAHVGSDLRMRIVRLLLGDQVVVELGETDPSRGRIVGRLKAKEEQV